MKKCIINKKHFRYRESKESSNRNSSEYSRIRKKLTGAFPNFVPDTIFYITEGMSMKRVLSAVLAAAVCVFMTGVLSGCDEDKHGSGDGVEYNIQATGNYSDGIMLPNLTTEQS